MRTKAKIHLGKFCIERPATRQRQHSLSLGGWLVGEKKLATWMNGGLQCWLLGGRTLAKRLSFVWYGVQGPPMIFENSVASRVS